MNCIDCLINCFFPFAMIGQCIWGLFQIFVFSLWRFFIQSSIAEGIVLRPVQIGNPPPSYSEVQETETPPPSYVSDSDEASENDSDQEAEEVFVFEQ